MPMTTTEHIRKIQGIAIFSGYVNKNPLANVSSCTTYYNSTNPRIFNTYEYMNQLNESRKHFSTSLG